jgi:hypothetical protein
VMRLYHDWDIFICGYLRQYHLWFIPLHFLLNFILEFTHKIKYNNSYMAG